MATIQERRSKTGKTSYRVMVRRKGFPAASATFERRTDAKSWATKTEAAMAGGLYFPEAEARRRTLGELLDRYIYIDPAREGEERDMVRNLRLRDPHRRAHLEWWRMRLGDHALALVTSAKLGELRDRLAAGDTPSGRPASPATQRRYLAALSHAFTFAVRELAWVAFNPVSKVTKPSEPPGRVRFLSREDDVGEAGRVVAQAELPRLLAACRASADRRLFPMVVLAITTGARQAELLGLRWKDCNLDRGTAELQRTKNHDRRTLVLTAPSLEALRELRKVRRLRSDLVFGDDRGRAVFPRAAWEEALALADIRDFNFHDCRHTFASYAAMAGASLLELKEALGHKTVAMVSRYSHLTRGHTRSMVERMVAETFGALVERESSQ